ncbi:hypothetical protein [Paludisphaera mucosa]|uniref:Uncharacterized protein n=1 Tax=Paludisphaera mucosa TaxID=3030827 RepID=A0ABT6FGZ4_9BACT|nr:hypothetical protein [Paludisphaera mucosa]MDG3006848.1 hypothetical protein [Paludisphaera mucosa]
MPYDGDPDHAIVERPWEYEIVSLCYHNDPGEWSASYIDMKLGRGDVVRRLRFLGPQDFAVEKGCFPQPTGGMRILDVSRRQLEGINLRVADFEATRGTVTCWAREVIDLDADSDSP